MKFHSIAVLLLGSTAFASSDVVEEALRITPPGATDLAPMKPVLRKSTHPNALTLVVDVWYPPEYTKCYSHEHKVELRALFFPASPIKMPLIRAMAINDSEEEN